MKISKSKDLSKKNIGIVIKNFPGYFLLICIIISAVSLFKIFQPFLTILLLAAILATVFHPLYDKLLVIFKNREKLASLTVCFLVLILIIVPLIIFILLLGKQAFDTYIFIQHQVQNGFLDPYLKWQKGGVIYDAMGVIRENLGSIIDIDSLDIKKSITDTAKIVTTFLASQSASIIKGFGGLFLSFFILFFALYYFFKDGEAIRKKLMIISPLPEEHEHQIIRKFKEMSMATLYGIFLTSIVQGIIGGIGFAIVGIPNALFWGTAIAVFSLVPVIGTATIWLPASIILLLSDHFFGGLFIFLWGLFIVSTVDNFLRAYVIGGRTNMNPLLMFLAVFGGIGVFGLVGVIFGPLILALFFTFLHIYEMEYSNMLHRKK